MTEKLSTASLTAQGTTSAHAIALDAKTETGEPLTLRASDFERFRAALLVAFQAILLIGAAVCLGLAMVAQEVVVLALGAKWADTGPLVQLYAISALFRIAELSMTSETLERFYAEIHKVVGGLRLPGDETGDCFKFTQGLAARAAQAGVKFLYGTDIQRLLTEGGRISGVHTDQGVLGDVPQAGDQRIPGRHRDQPQHRPGPPQAEG